MEILLLEPNYSNKYPPLGLMKISYFHKKIRKDYVRFAKGTLPDAFNEKKWDRVYVATLFTFEWEETKRTIEYAISVVKDKANVFVGGILATLMPDLIRKTFGIEPTIGLLNKANALGLPNDECIDNLPHDYSMLEDIEYQYPAHDAYFLYMTRGCGMRCEFCAVQKLEPTYIPYLSIRNQIEAIRQEYGEKRDLLLMDNNVLRSTQFDAIIDEIKSLGFAKNAKYTNPITKKGNQRFIDFNQGLDAKLLNDHKAKRLGELALRPARIAFDHIEDKAQYEHAVTLCAKNGIKHLSNYILYNADDFTGKGQSYKADTPEDLFIRMQFTMDLGDELNKKYGQDGRIHIFSFPMRYIPLNDLKRGYIGSKWTAKYLRAVQRMLIPTSGKGVSSRSFFEADFGKTPDEFLENLAMPEDLLSIRGHFVAKKDENAADRKTRYLAWQENQSIIVEWKTKFRSLADETSEFLSHIQNNDFSVKNYATLKTPKQRKTFVHYMSKQAIVRGINNLNEPLRKDLLGYITEEFPLYYQQTIKYVLQINVPYSSLTQMIKALREQFFIDIFEYCSKIDAFDTRIFNSLYKAQKEAKCMIFDTRCLDYINLYCKAGVITPQEYKKVMTKAKTLDSTEIKKILRTKLAMFIDACKNVIDGEIDKTLLTKEFENNLKRIKEYLEIK